MTKHTSPQIWVSIDGEFTGRAPGVNSMISLGAVAYSDDEREISRFKINMRELYRSVRDDDTMRWWKERPEAWRAATENAISAQKGMEQFARWLKALSGHPVLLGWPIAVDFMFVCWYYVRFVGDPPFGHSGLDIRTYAMRTFGFRTYGEASKADVCAGLGIPYQELSHDSLEDAREQARLFFALRRKISI